MEADEAAWTECNDILDQVKQNNAHEGLRRLCTLSLESDVASVREWTHATIADALEWHESRLACPPKLLPSAPSASSLLAIGASLQMQYDLVKEHVLDLLLHREHPIPHSTSIELQDLMANDIDDTALFVELANVLLCEHPISDISPSFEARVSGCLGDLSMPARFNLWTQFPHVWERQVATWLHLAHATPLLSASLIIMSSSSADHDSAHGAAAALFRTMYLAAPHLHAVALDVCQRLLVEYPTHRTLELEQTLGRFAQPHTPVDHLGGRSHGFQMPPPMAWWELAQGRDWLQSMCHRVLRPPRPISPEDDEAYPQYDQRTSWIAALTAVFSMQCTTTQDAMHVYAMSLVSAIHSSSSIASAGGASPSSVFAWLQQHRDAAVVFAPITVAMLCCWIATTNDTLASGLTTGGAAPPPVGLDAVVAETLACIEYLLRLAPPRTITRRAHQISLLGVVLSWIECTESPDLKERHVLCVHPTIEPALRELMRVMAVDGEVALPGPWQVHACARLACRGRHAGAP